MDFLHRSAARSKLASWIALKLRNQCSAVLKYRLGGVHHADPNGEDLLLKTYASHISTFVDVGANVGDWTAEVLASTAGRPVNGILFEPGLSAYLALTKRFSGATNLDLVNKAISDQVGEVVFYDEDGAGETSSMAAKANLRPSIARRVECSTLSAELSQRDVQRIDLLKVDVEGFDLHVLRGAGAMLNPETISLIQFEYNSSWIFASSTLYSAIELLRSRGFNVFRLDGDGLHEPEYDRYGEYFSYANYVAVAPAVLGYLQTLRRGTIV